MLRPWLYALVVGGVLMHAMPGCVIGGPDDTLNPQPLPPRSDPPAKSAGDQDNSTGGGNTASPSSPRADAGVDRDVDGGDGGDGGRGD